MIMRDAAAPHSMSNSHHKHITKTIISSALIRAPCVLDEPAMDLAIVTLAVWVPEVLCPLMFIGGAWLNKHGASNSVLPPSLLSPSDVA